jgi:hypothetical protein
MDCENDLSSLHVFHVQALRVQTRPFSAFPCPRERESDERFTPTECNNTEKCGYNLPGFGQNINTPKKKSAVQVGGDNLGRLCVLVLHRNGQR